MSKATALDLGDDVLVSAGKDQASKLSIFGRFYAALMASRQAQADREIEQYIQRQGGVLTDNVEREISRRYGTMAG